VIDVIFLELMGVSAEYKCVKTAFSTKLEIRRQYDVALKLISVH